MQPSQVSYKLDLTTSELTWDDALFTSYGYDRSEPATTVEWWTSHIHPEDAMLLNHAMDRLTDPTANDWVVEYRFRKADNSYVLVQDHATVLRDDDGRPLRLAGTLTPKML